LLKSRNRGTFGCRGSLLNLPERAFAGAIAFAAIVGTGSAFALVGIAAIAFTLARHRQARIGEQIAQV